jgi:isoleucyl-tRNA synthetase
LHSTILEVTELFDSYKLNEIPWTIEALYLELSRTYMQLVREKSSVGSKEDKELIASTIYEVLYELLRLLTPITPFICEKIYLDLKEEFELKEDSVSFEIWPKADKRRINKKLEEQFEVIEPIIQNILSEREKSQLGVRWPLAKVEMTVKTEEEKEAIETLKEIIMTQTNVKNVLVNMGEPKIELDTNLTPQLEAEGFAREVSRRIQALRKTAGLKKDDNIHLHIKCSDKLKVCLEEFDDYIKEKCGASELNVCCESPKEKHHHEKKEKVKDEEFEIHFNKK